LNTETKNFLDQINAYLNEGNYSELDKQLTIENITSHQHWLVYYGLFLVELNERNNVKNALEAAESGLALNPEHIQLQWFRVLAFLKLEDWGSACFFGESYCDENKQDYNAHFDVANAYRHAGNSDKGNELESIGHAYYGFAAIRAGNAELAYEAFSNAVNINPEYHLARMQKIKQQRRLGMFDEAKAELLQCIECSTIKQDALVELCFIAQQEEDLSGIEKYANKILATDPKQQFALNAKIKLAQIQGETNKVFQTANDTVDTVPSNLFAHFVRFSAAYEMANSIHLLNSTKGGLDVWRQLNSWLETNLVEAAITRAERLLVNNDKLPIDDVVRFFSSLMNNEHYAEIKKLYELSCDLVKSTEEIQCFYGHALAYTVSYNKSTSFFYDKSTEFPEKFIYQFYWAYWKGYYFALKPNEDIAEDIATQYSEILLKGIEDGYGDGKAIYTLGSLYCRLNRYEEAEVWINKTDDLKIRSALLNYWRADLCCHQQDFVSALDIYIDGFYKRLHKDSKCRGLSELKDAILFGLVDSCTQGEEVHRKAVNSLEYYKQDLTSVEKVQVAFWFRDAGLAEKSFEWFVTGADEGVAVASYAVGFAYEFGNGIEKNIVKAVEYYEAAGDGYPQAYLARARIIEEGKFLPYSEKEIVKWMTLAAEKGELEAAGHLAQRLTHVESVQDYTQAFKWAKYSAEEGNLHSQNLLAYLYQNGLGVEKDNDIAMQWYQKSKGDKEYSAKDLEESAEEDKKNIMKKEGTFTKLFRRTIHILSLLFIAFSLVAFVFVLVIYFL
jgi:TPR repeat protein